MGKIELPPGVKAPKNIEAKPFQVANDIDKYRVDSRLPLNTVVGGCLLFVANALVEYGRKIDVIDDRCDGLEARIEALERTALGDK